MTERKIAQQIQAAQKRELLAQAKALRDNDAHKTLFLQLLSHELRSPLNPVTMILSTILNRDGREGYATDATQTIPPQILDDLALIQRKCLIAIA